MDYLNDVLSLLDKVQGLSAVALVCFSCVVVGYVLRFIKQFPNDGIPVAVVLWGMVAMLVIADPHPAAMPMRIWTARNLMVGAIVGFIAWMLHKIVLSKIEDYITKRFPGSDNTTFFNKPDPAVKPEDKPPTP